MEEQIDSGETTQEVNPIDNVKAEFQRKLSNQDQNLQEIKAQLAELSARFTTPRQEAAPEEDLSDIAYDPQKLAKVIQNQVSSQVSAAQQKQQRLNATYGELLGKFPELGNPQSDLYQAVQGRIVGISPDDVSSLKSAVLETALDMGIAPSGQRRKQTQDHDHFSVGSKSGSATTTRKEKVEDIPEVTKIWSQLLGRDVEDPAYKKRIKTSMGILKRKMNEGDY